MTFEDGTDTHLYCASAVGVNDSLTLPSKQIDNPGCKFVAKTLSIPIHELNAWGSIGETRFRCASRVEITAYLDSDRSVRGKFESVLALRLQYPLTILFVAFCVTG